MVGPRRGAGELAACATCRAVLVKHLLYAASHHSPCPPRVGHWGWAQALVHPLPSARGHMEEQGDSDLEGRGLPVTCVTPLLWGNILRVDHPHSGRWRCAGHRGLCAGCVEQAQTGNPRRPDPGRTGLEGHAEHSTGKGQTSLRSAPSRALGTAGAQNCRRRPSSARASGGNGEHCGTPFFCPPGGKAEVLPPRTAGQLLVLALCLEAAVGGEACGPPRPEQQGRPLP